MDLYDEIYYTLIGQMADQGLSWVPNAFATGSDCDEAYTRLIQARDRLLERLGREEDPDLSIMLDEMYDITHALCRAVLALRKM